MDEERIYQAIDACRPGSRDISQPEMSPLAARLAAERDLRLRYERTQRVDAAIAGALANVDVPHGLAEGLMAEIEAQTPHLAEATAGPPPHAVRDLDSTPGGADDAARRRARPKRRAVFGVLGGTAAAVIVAGIFFFYPRPEFTVDRLVDLAKHVSRAQLDPANWNRFTDGDVPRYPFYAGLLARPLFWQEVHLDGKRGVAYRLPGPAVGQSSASLLVFRGLHIVDGLPSSPPAQPQSTTGRITAAAWQDGDVTFVLVVDGNIDAYRRLIPPSGGWA